MLEKTTWCAALLLACLQPCVGFGQPNKGIYDAAGRLNSPAPQFLSPPQAGVSGFPVVENPLFDSYKVFAPETRPAAVAVGDVTGDQLNDVVFCSSDYCKYEREDKLVVLRQNPVTHELDTPTSYSAPGRPESIDLGDLNGDGRNDVVLGFSSAKCFGILLQNSNGTFDDITTYPTTEGRCVKIGDFNHDGKKDLVSMGWGTHQVAVRLQDDSGKLGDPTYYEIYHGGYEEVEVGDLNNDGRDDIVVMSGQADTNAATHPHDFGVLLQKADGGFEAPLYFDTGSTWAAQGLSIGDVNSDGLQDVVVSYGGNRPNSTLGIFYQNGSGRLDSSVTSCTSYECPESPAIGDADLDGQNDIIVPHGGWFALGVYRQAEDATMQQEELYDIPYASHYNLQGVVVTDINNDYKTDVVIGDYCHGLVVLYHKGTSHTDPEPPQPPQPPQPPTGETSGTAHLEVSVSTFDKLVHCGQAVTYTVVVKNTGPGNAADVVTTSILPAGLSCQGGVASQGGMTYIGGMMQASFGFVPAGQSAILTVFCTAAVPGVYTHMASCGASNMDETSVATDAEVVGVDVCDLSGKFNSVAASARGRKSSLRASLTMANLGNITASSAPVSFYLSSDERFSPESDTLLKSASCTNLKPQQAKRVNLNATLGAGVLASGKYLIAVLDPAFTMTEMQETNNVVVWGPLP